MGKKALVVVSFGTAWPEARRAIEKLEERLRCAFPTHDFYRSFTSELSLIHISSTRAPCGCRTPPP